MRDLVFREANAEFVLCMDSHVLFRPGALATTGGVTSRPAGLLGPVARPVDRGRSEAHRDALRPRVARRDVRGLGDDPRGLDPGATRVRDPDARARGVWLPPGRVARVQSPAARVRRGRGLSPREDSAGGRPDALPAVPRLDAPLQSAVRAALSRVGGGPGPQLPARARRAGPRPALGDRPPRAGVSAPRPCGRMVDRVEQELRGPFHFFDAIYCINLDDETGRWESVMRQCKALGIDHRIRRFTAIDTPTARGIGRALSHRAIVAEAKWQGLEQRPRARRRRGLLAPDRGCAGAEPRRAARAGVGLLSLGASGGDQASPAGVGRPISPDRAGVDVSARGRLSPHRLRPDLDGPTGHAHGNGPLAPDAHLGIGHYYADRLGGMSLVTCPSIATQPSLLPREVAPFEPLAVPS